MPTLHPINDCCLVCKGVIGLGGTSIFCGVCRWIPGAAVSRLSATTVVEALRRLLAVAERGSTRIDDLHDRQDLITAFHNFDVIITHQRRNSS